MNSIKSKKYILIFLGILVIIFLLYFIGGFFYLKHILQEGIRAEESEKTMRTITSLMVEKIILEEKAFSFDINSIGKEYSRNDFENLIRILWIKDLLKKYYISNKKLPESLTEVGIKNEVIEVDSEKEPFFYRKLEDNKVIIGNMPIEETVIKDLSQVNKNTVLRRDDKFLFVLHVQGDME